MRKFLFFLIFLISPLVQCQTLRGIYIKQSLEGVGDDTKLNEKAKAPVVYEYLYSNDFSIQTLLDLRGTTIDTIRTKNEKYDFIQESIMKTALMAKAVIYKDFKNDIIEQNRMVDKEETFIREKLPVFNWAITDDTKIIEGFKCRKATTEMTTYGYVLPITVWFCEDVPISDGPITLNGLPGFIFEASSGKIFNFKFKNFSFNKKEIVKIEAIKTNAIPKTTKKVENIRN